MILLTSNDIKYKYGILECCFSNGIYKLNDFNYLFVYNHLYIILTEKELNIIPKYYKYTVYNIYNESIFLLERYKNNINFIKKVYNLFRFNNSDDISNIIEFKRLIDILYNNKQYNLSFSDIVNKYNISKIVVEYIYKSQF